jgi:hypothetical protein
MKVLLFPNLSKRMSLFPRPKSFFPIKLLLLHCVRLDLLDEDDCPALQGDCQLVMLLLILHTLVQTSDRVFGFFYTNTIGKSSLLLHFLF